MAVTTTAYGQPGPLPDSNEAAPDAVAGPIAPQEALPPPPSPPAEPVVVRSGISNTNMALLVGAGLGVGLGVGFVFAAHADARDADAARSYADYERISSRSDRLYVASVVTAAAGIGLAALAIYRIKISKEHDTSVAIAPTADGGAFVLSRTW